MKDQSDVLKIFAENIADRIVRKAIRELKQIKVTLSGEDSCLDNAWEEICAQVQYQNSYFWEAYEGTAWSIISQQISKLKCHELLAVWFQTDAGWDWDFSPVISREHYENMSDIEKEARQERVEDDDPPLSIDDIERYIQHRLYSAAEVFTNKRIEKYLENYV